MFRLNTNVDKKDRSVVSMHDFKGLDTVHSPMNISYQHAIDMRNLINRNGVNRKRHGWRQEKSFDKESLPLGTWEGLLEYKDENDEIKYVNVLLHFYLKDNDLIVKTLKSDYSDANITVTINKYLTDNFSQGEANLRFYFFEGKLYFVGLNTLFVCYAENETNIVISTLNYLANSTFVNNSGEVYIPTTYELTPIGDISDVTDASQYFILSAFFNLYLNIDFYDYTESVNSKKYDDVKLPEEQSFSTKALEDINILTSRVKNTLVKEFTQDEIDALRATGANNLKTVVGAVRITQMKGYDISWYEGSQATTEGLYYRNRDTFYFGIYVDIYVNGIFFKTIGGEDNPFVKNQAEFELYNPDRTVYLTTYIPQDKSVGISFCGKTFVFEARSILEAYGIDLSDERATISSISFEVSFFRRSEEENKNGVTEKILKPTLITAFGPEGVPTRLFYSEGNNVIYFSEYRNPLYIGAQNTIVLGSTPITGWIKGTETSLYVFKQYSRQEESLYVIDGELVTSEDNQYNVNEGEVVFRNKGYMLPESAVNQDSVCSLSNDVLIVSNDGVYGVTLSANVASTERFARSRAEQIKNLLQEQDLSTAKCVVWDNKMFLAVDGLVFVADARFRASFDGDMADTFNYEWWLWDNVPLKYWVIIQDKLCFVTDDNRICAFYDGFSDYIFDDLLVAVLDDDGVTISKEYADYNKIVLNAAYKACVDSVDITGIINGALVINSERLYTAINEGDTIYFDVTAGTISGYPVTVNTPYTVKSIDILNGQVTFTTADGTAVAFMSAMASLLQENPLRISKAATQQYDMEIDATAESNNTRIYDSDGNIIQLIEYNGVSSYSATIYKNKPVTAYWQTGSYDFGSSMYAKTIERFSVAFDRESPKKMKLYFSTAYNGKNQLFKELKKNLDFDFENLSFLLFTFDKRFETSYTRRLLIRNFNFISFLLSSDEAEDFSVDSMSFVYKVNKLNRGER